MRTHLGKSLSTIAALMVVLVLASFALAMWTETLRVESVVKTGYLDVSYDNVMVVEKPEIEGKDVGECSYELKTANDMDILEIKIKNGYPGYECSVFFDIVNTGTIPVVGPFYNVSSIPEGIEVVFTPPRIAQLHPGEKASYSVTVKVLQEAVESTEYSVTIEITYVQWNEVIIPAVISGFVWLDYDQDGYWDEYEPALASVLVRLYRNGELVAEVHTDECGYYEFTVSPGKTYVIAPVLLSGHEFTTPENITIYAAMGGIYTNNNFGMYYPPPPPPPGLSVGAEFRHTDYNLEQCPARLGSVLENIKVTINNKGEVQSVSPGAFYYMINISGVGLTSINLTLKYDFHFNIDGKEVKEVPVRAYLLNTTSGCAIDLKKNITYRVDNINDIAVANITLTRPLGQDAVIIVLVKFKPAGISGHNWNSLDKYFDVEYNIETNIGSANGTSRIEIKEEIKSK